MEVRIQYKYNYRGMQNFLLNKEGHFTLRHFTLEGDDLLSEASK